MSNLHLLISMFTNCDIAMVPAPGSTYQERMSWFNDPNTVEFQDVTRTQHREEESKILRLYRLKCKEKCRSMERLIIKQCLQMLGLIHTCMSLKWIAICGNIFSTPNKHFPPLIVYTGAPIQIMDITGEKIFIV